MLMINNDDICKYEKSLEALLTAAFRLDFPEDLSDEDAVHFFQQPAQLSLEDREAIDSWGNDFVEALLKGEKPVLSEQEQEDCFDVQLEQEFYAMNRDKNGNDLNDETRNKIDEERKKTIDEESRDNEEYGET